MAGECSKESYVAYAVLLALSNKEFKIGDVPCKGAVSVKTMQRSLNALVSAGLLEKRRGEKNYRPSSRLFEELTSNFRDEDDWYGFLQRLLNATFKPATRNPVVAAMRRLLSDIGEL